MTSPKPAPKDKDRARMEPDEAHSGFDLDLDAGGAPANEVEANTFALEDLLPNSLKVQIADQTLIPRIAKDKKIIAAIEARLPEVETTHKLYNCDSRKFKSLKPESVHLVITSPPYWTLKEYRDGQGQLGHVEDYESFLNEIDKVWKNCYDALVPGGRLVIVVGDVCLSRKQNHGRHTVVPLHASIQERCRAIGFDNLAPIIWHKIANANYEVSNGSAGFLGKPYEPNSVIKNDIEYILMQRKPGGYRSPSAAKRIFSVISTENYHQWFQQIWSGVTGASTREHPAPYPLELADRLIRMFSFVGDTVLDPFMGTGTTNLAAAEAARNSIGVEVDATYFAMAGRRFRAGSGGLFKNVRLLTFKNE